MKRIEDVRTVLFVHEQNHSSTYRNKIRMRHVEAATVGNVDYERPKVWA
ncbi:MAG TPA: hypothetical protein VE031_12590 [Chthoniobacterales bacterium]|nr:hypothetical protein [Chthoniobacterales bacterium]